MSVEIDLINKKLQTGRSREHDKVLILEHAVKDHDDAIKKLWGVVNSKLQAKGEIKLGRK